MRTPRLSWQAARRRPSDRPPSLAWAPGEAIGTLRFLSQLAVREPQTLLRDTPGTALELLRIALGKSQVTPEKGDKRFADPAWKDNPLFRRTMQTYLYYGSRVDPFIDSLGIEGMNRERAASRWPWSGRPWRRPTPS